MAKLDPTHSTKTDKTDTRSQQRRDLDAFLKDPKYHAHVNFVDGSPNLDIVTDLPWLPRPDQEDGYVSTTLGEFVRGTVKLDLALAAKDAELTSVAYFWHDYGSAGQQVVTIVRTRDEMTPDGRFRFLVSGASGYHFWTYTRLLEEYPENLHVHVVILYPPLGTRDE